MSSVDLEKLVLHDIVVLSRSGLPPREEDLYTRAITIHKVSWKDYLEALHSLERKGEVYEPRAGMYAITSSEQQRDVEGLRKRVDKLVDRIKEAQKGKG